MVDHHAENRSLDREYSLLTARRDIVGKQWLTSRRSPRHTCSSGHMNRAWRDGHFGDAAGSLSWLLRRANCLIKLCVAGSCAPDGTDPADLIRQSHDQQGVQKVIVASNRV